MAKVFLILGGICCGKTTYAEKLREETGAVILSVDEIMLRLFGQHAGDKHDEYARRTQAYLLDKAAEIAQSGMNVILDWGFWTRQSRCEARAFFAARGIETELHWLDVSENVWRERLKKRNAEVLAGRGDAYLVDDALAEKFRGIFEPPEENEADRRIIV